VVRIHHVALRTTDVARLERFYGGVLGLAVVRRDDARGSVWLDADGTVLMIERSEAGEPGIPEATRELIAFAVADKEAWRARLPAVEAETAYTLYFRDPDGRRIAVSDYPLPAR
jgi:catechol 2,3-dioxygenase-like lactoylglutathione lyase family enzyme